MNTVLLKNNARLGRLRDAGFTAHRYSIRACDMGHFSFSRDVISGLATSLNNSVTSVAANLFAASMGPRLLGYYCGSVSWASQTLSLSFFESGITGLRGWRRNKLCFSVIPSNLGSRQDHLGLLTWACQTRPRLGRNPIHICKGFDSVRSPPTTLVQHLPSLFWALYPNYRSIRFELSPFKKGLQLDQ